MWAVPINISTLDNMSIFKLTKLLSFTNISKNQNCKIANSFNSFSILDYVKTDYELALKEAMHIKWSKPKLNGQKKHEIFRLFA